MKIERVAEHSFCPELMTNEGYVLDLGCRGFQFFDHMESLGYLVMAVDADRLDSKGRLYHNIAITDYNGYCEGISSPDPQAFRVGNKTTDGIKCFTLPHFMNCFEVDFFDLIKMDVEGSEKQIIMSLTEPPAKQLSIEFHLHTGIYTKPDVDVMVSKLESLGYEAVQHNMTSEHGCGLNMWDSLFILK